MERDDRKLDGSAQRGEHRTSQLVHEPAAGKVTRTSKLETGQSPVVQRKAAPAGVAPARAGRPSADWSSDVHLDMAHRGLTALSEEAHGAVQARGAVDAEDPASVHRAAAAGVSGSGSALPNLDRIQAAFGTEHDLSQVRAHVGGTAREASAQMGAQAYATGDNIAFGSQPDLHTAAHEAAHVVQQRAGVQLSGGVGRAGDAYERQADAVADRVVRGESAGALLDGMTGASGAQDTVQRQEAPEQEQAPPGQDAPPVEPGAAPPDVDALIAALQLTAPALGAADNALEIADALTWVESVQQRLRDAIQGHDGLPADHADRARLAAAITTATQQASGHMTTLATAIRTRLLALMKASSPVEETPAAGDTPVQAPAPPVLPGVPDVDRLRTAAAGLSHDAHGTSTALVDADRQTLAGAAGSMADAALAIYQSRGVLSARTDWITGYRQSSIPIADAAGVNPASTALRRDQGARDGLNSIFRDSDFNSFGVQAIATDSGWEPHDWCGMFVITHLFRGSGFDKELRAGLLEVTNVTDFFHYTQVASPKRIPVTVWVPEEGQWMDLHEYHQLRGSERTWMPRAAIQAEIQQGGAPFRSGDVGMLNHLGGDVAQHIVMVDSYDAATGELRTIEGNTLGLRSNDQGLITRTRGGELAADRGETSVGMHIREMNGERPDRQGPGAYQNRAGNTVLGRGRLSVVDFEDHRYSTLPMARFPQQARRMSPEEMDQKARDSNLVKPALDRGPAATP